MTMLGGKGDGERAGPIGNGQARPAAKPYAGATPKPAASREPESSNAFSDMDDDIPF